MVTVEPAEAVPDHLDTTTSGLFTAAAAALTWRSAERARSKAELFLALAEASGREQLGPILARACRSLAGLLGMRRASVFLVAEDALVPRMSRLADGSTDLDAWEAFRHPKEPFALAEAVLRSGSPAAAEHPDCPLIAGWWSTRFSLGAALGVPIRSGDSTLGVLVVDGDRPRSFTPAHVRLVCAVGTQLGGILQLAKQRAERDQQLAVAAALNDLFRAGVHSRSVLEAAEAVARTTTQVLGVESACTYLVDGARRITELVTVGTDPDRVVALRRRLIGALASDSPVWQHSVEAPEPGPYLVPEIRPTGQVRPEGMATIMGLRCLAAIPLMSSDGPLGVVVCGDTTGPRTWRSAEHDLLLQLALATPIVIDNARLRETEHHLATHDGLTGLANRRAFDELMGRTLAQARRTGGHVAVLLVDLDRFKQVNDTFGHPEGDALLVEVARRLRSALREADVVARLGGDEFAALLAGTDATGAIAAAERVTDALETSVTLSGSVVQVGASIGISCWPEHGHDAEMLLRHADVAMYAAKERRLPSFLYDPAWG